MFALANSEDAVLLKLKNIGKIYDSNERDSKKWQMASKKYQEGCLQRKR